MSTPGAARRPQAPRVARPAVRYWKGKAPKGAQDAPSDSDEDEEEQVEETREDEDEEITDIIRQDESEGEEDDGGKPKQMNIALKDVNIRDGRVIVAGREESGRTDLEQQVLEEESSEEEEEEEAKGEDESSEYESESEEEEPPKPQFRPVFVPKRGRATIAEREALAEDTEEALKRKEEEAEERKKQSHDLVAESIRRELAEKEKEEQVPDLDDTDGLDPEGEFEAWRLRELGRIKRDKEDEFRREREREEIERRRALPEAQRMQEDLEHAQKLRDEKPKGQQKFLQKYWHKGAFHQDEEILTKRDYTEATESTLDITLLPKVMQVRNFGKRSQTKYTHLVDQDTTVQSGGFGNAGAGKPGGKSTDASGCFVCGGPHMKKDCPQNPGPGFHGRVTGANSTPAGPRSWKGDSGEWRDRDRDDDARPSRPPPPRYDGNGWQDKSKRRSRSRSPRRSRDDDRRRSRSRTPPRRYRDDDRHERRPRSRSRERARVENDDHREKRRRYG